MSHRALKKSNKVMVLVKSFIPVRVCRTNREKERKEKGKLKKGVIFFWACILFLGSLGFLSVGASSYLGKNQKQNSFC